MLIDINAFIGEWPFGEIPYRTADGLLTLMDRHGIDQAAVSSMHGIFYKLCDVANRRLWDEIQGHTDRLVPVGTINPTFPGWERDLKQCVDDLSARAIKFFPTYHGYGVASAECCEAINAAVELGAAVILSVSFEDARVHHWATQIEPMEMQDLAELVATMRGKRIVLSSIHTAEVRSLLSAAPESDFCVEISHMEGPIMCVQDLVKDIGAERVLLGTQMPFMNPAGAIAAVNEPGFEAEDRQRVMAGNARRFLGL